MFEWLKSKTKNINVENVLCNVAKVTLVIGCVAATIAVFKSALSNSSGLPSSDMLDAGDGNWLSARAIDIADITVAMTNKVVGIADETGEIVGYAILDDM